uniref:Uncharacterized protein n=1 Tax=Meloidogyne enterolobii TaxID=390850 RepID=A0A6V7XT95_MELEN|nr:unnamed protein product [Meloidogyne enterolobii]
MISVGHLVGRNRLHRPSNALYPAPVRNTPFIHTLKNAEIQNGTRIIIRGFILRNSKINKMEVALLHEVMELTDKCDILIINLKIFISKFSGCFGVIN